MRTTREIIKELRSDLAALKSRLIALSENKLLSESQSEAVDQAMLGLSFIVCQYICMIRKAYGEHFWYRLEKVDKPPEPKEVSVSPRSQLTEIIENVREINVKMITLPGRDGCNDEQSKAIGQLFSGYADWRIDNLNQLVISFAKYN